MTRADRLRAFVEQFNRGDFAATGELLAEDVRWMPRLEPTDGALEGREQVLRTWAEQRAAFGGDFSLELGAMEELGGGVVLAEVAVHGRGAHSGLEVSDRYVTVATFRGGRIVRVDNYDTREQALADLS